MQAISTGKSEGKAPRVRLRCRCEDIIKADFKEIRSDGVDWIHVAQDRDHWRDLVNTVMGLRVL
jgi:hypothetical protein